MTTRNRRNAWRLGRLLVLLLALPLLAQEPQTKEIIPPVVQGELNRAQNLMENGDPTSAIYLYTQILEKYRAPEAARRIAQYYEKTGDYAQAAKYLGIVVSMRPAEVQARLDYARLLSWSGKGREAIPQYQEILKSDPKQAEALIGLARVYSWTKNYSASVATYRKALALDASKVDVRVELGRVLGWAGRLNEAAAELDRALKLEPHNVDAEVTLARVFSWQGKLDEALLRFDAALAERPRHPDALLGKTQVLLWKGNLAAAKQTLARVPPPDASGPEARDLRRAIAQAELGKKEGVAAAPAETKPGQPAPAPAPGPAPTPAQAPEVQAKLAAAQQLAWDGRYQEAIAAYREILKEHPDEREARLGLARTYSWDKKFSESVQLYREVLQQTPGDSAVRLELARVLSWSGSFAESVSEYQQVLKEKPDLLEAEIGLARVTAWQGKLDQALAMFRETLRKHPHTFDADLGIGQVLLWKGDLEQARAVLATLRAGYPASGDLESFARALDEAEKQALARLQQEQQMPAAAPGLTLAEVKQKLEQEPGDAALWRRMGDLYQAQNQLPDAIAAYEKLVQLPAASDQDRLQLARFYSWNKQLASAITAYQDYLARHGEDEQVRLELARNLSWTGRYAESEASYSQLLDKHPEERETRLGLARVLSWDKKYTESLKQYAILQEKYPDDREVGIEQARVNSWSGNFPRALRLYNRILAKYPKDRDALLGKGQVLTWTGRGPEALGILEPLHKQYPQDRDVALVWASAQQSVGRSDVALAALDQLNMIDPTNRDVRNLMESVRRSLRPELNISFWSALDSSRLHTYVFKGTYSFNTGPRMRSFVSITGIPSSAPFAGEFNAQEFAYGFSARVRPRVEVRLDGGLSHLSTGANDFVGGAGFSLYPASRLKVDFDFSQRAINVVPSAVPFDVTRYGPALAFRFDFDRKTWLEVNAFHYQYSDTNTQNGGGASFLRRVWGGEGKGLAVGYLFAYSGFTRDIDSGFFAPRRFQRHAAQLVLQGRFSKRFGYSFYGTLGKEKFARADTPLEQIRFNRDGTATFGLSYDINDRTSMGVSYSYLNLALPGASGGAFRTNGVSAYTRIRF